MTRIVRILSSRRHVRPVDARTALIREWDRQLAHAISSADALEIDILFAEAAERIAA